MKKMLDLSRDEIGIGSVASLGILVTFGKGLVLMISGENGKSWRKVPLKLGHRHKCAVQGSKGSSASPEKYTIS